MEDRPANILANEPRTGLRWPPRSNESASPILPPKGGGERQSGAVRELQRRALVWLRRPATNSAEDEAQPALRSLAVPAGGRSNALKPISHPCNQAVIPKPAFVVRAGLSHAASDPPDPMPETFGLESPSMSCSLETRFFYRAESPETLANHVAIFGETIAD